MSIVSKWMIGAMASKKASDSVPNRAASAWASRSDVRGPVATIPGESISRASPRTTSIRVSPEAITAVRDFIGEKYGKPYLPEAPNTYTSKAARVQDAHEAIRPTDVRRRPEHVEKYMEPDQFRLYQLIWQRFVASQMTPAVYDMTIVDFDLGRYLVRASGSVMIFDGYHVLYTEGREARKRPRS